MTMTSMNELNNLKATPRSSELVKISFSMNGRRHKATGLNIGGRLMVTDIALWIEPRGKAGHWRSLSAQQQQTLRPLVASNAEKSLGINGAS